MTGRTRDLEVLDRRTCLDLLARVEVGRLAWADDDGQVEVLPVNFALTGDVLVVRSEPGAKVVAARSGRRFTFEADDLEPALRTGWSVLAKGPVDVVEDPCDLRRTVASVDTWADVSEGSVLRMRITEITGRRVPLAAGGVTVLEMDPEMDEE
jgi:uncharacterized protein